MFRRAGGSPYVYLSVVCAFLCFILRLLPLNSTPYPLPLPDSPYNSLQVKFLCERGMLYFDAPILSFAIAALINFVFRDPTLAVKIAASLFAAGATLSTFYFARSIRGRDVDGFFASLAVVFSLYSLRMAEHLLKNSAAVAFMPVAVALYFVGLKSMDRRKILLASLFSCLVAFSHTSTAGLTGSILVSITLYFFFKRIWERKYVDAVVLFGYAALSALIMISAFFVADYISPYYSSEYTSIDVGKALGYVGSTVESPFHVLMKVRFGYEHLVGFAFMIILAFLLSRIGDIALLLLSLLSTFIASGVVPGSWDIRIILTGFPFYAASVGVLGGLVVDRLSSEKRSKYILALIAFSSFIFAAFAPIYFAFASRIRSGLPEELIVAIKSMDGVFEDDSLFFAGVRVVYYIPLYTRYDANIMLNGTGYYIPVNPLYMAGMMLSYEKTTGRSTYLLLLPSDPMYRILNPFKVVKPFAIIASPMAYDVTNSTEIVVIERLPISSIRFNVRRRGVVIYSGELMKVDFNRWIGSFPPTLSQGDYELELIFKIQDKIERVHFPFIYSVFDFRGLFLEAWSFGKVKVYRLNVDLADRLDLDEKSYSPPKRARVSPPQRFDLSLLLFPLILIDAGEYNTLYKLFFAVPVTSVFYCCVLIFLGGSVLGWLSLLLGRRRS
ncbi:MAG: hypothetical protein DRJ20_01275 [Candidatus Methanomethylicota archaeon]|uniref:Membrane protein 6-pyruvoyl-tetrahydropterin synthase-related domain-containing protein n=2 Tax=Thermoproteota archaeon TaxID=2056631 RepID=A0A497EWW4_9CREN|nr:MAG: hypothetical protein DRJ20_01275 [Candidatus Verstraetearchaeota archaeon]